MNFSIGNVIGKAISGLVTGFSVAVGVAAAKWIVIYVPLSGFNLSF